MVTQIVMRSDRLGTDAVPGHTAWMVVANTGVHQGRQDSKPSVCNPDPGVDSVVSGVLASIALTHCAIAAEADHRIMRPMRSRRDLPPTAPPDPAHPNHVTSSFEHSRLDPSDLLKIFRLPVDVSLERQQLREEHHEEEQRSQPRRLTSPISPRRRSRDLGHDTCCTGQRRIQESGSDSRPDNVVDSRDHLVPDVVRPQLVLTRSTSQPGGER